MDSEEETTIEEVVEHVALMKPVEQQRQDKEAREKVHLMKDNMDLIEWLDEKGVDYNIPTDIVKAKEFFIENREAMLQSGFKSNREELTQDDIVSDVTNDVYDDNGEPEEKKDKVTTNNKWVVEYINQLPVERDFSNSWYRAKDVISYAGLSWQGRISLKNIPIKWTVNKQKKLYISKEAIVYILFSGKSKKALSFTKKVIEELCND